MKLTKDQENKLTELCFAGVSNKEIAEELKIELKNVHAARSRLGITIPKIKEMKSRGAQPSGRTKEEIQQEIDKVRKAMSEALKKMKRCDERIDQLTKELEA